MERNLRVVGSASKQFSPDTVKVFMNLEAVAKTAALAKSIFTSKSNLMTNIIKQLGYNSDDLLTENFFVNKNFVYENNKRIQEGYKATCTYSIIIDLDYEGLDQLISSLSQGLEMGITYEVMLKEREKEEDMVLQEAIQDAKTRAEKLAKACGVKLGDIVGINYNDGPGFALMRSSAKDTAIVPSEVTISKTIEIMWEIK